MELSDFPQDIRSNIIPKTSGQYEYHCLKCQKIWDIDRLLYTCPSCGSVLMIEDQQSDRLKQLPGKLWHKIFNYRKLLNIQGLKGIFRYHEFLGAVLPLDALVYLGEAHTPMIEANNVLQNKMGICFYYKNDGQNPSASFKDRGMACALSYINYLIRSGKLSEVLAICASTGDTSAAAALYGAYLAPHIKTAVLLPHKKVTPQQLSQPLGSGAKVFEIPGVFDDCMKVVEALADQYHVALLNSKNAWRILGQESYSYEIAQDFDYKLKSVAIVVPIGNAGNITAVMNGFIKFFNAGVITHLPRIIGVQSHHADPVFQYYAEKDLQKRQYKAVTVKPSVAQAAMIGNPVSMPRVIDRVNLYNEISGKENVFVVQVTEQQIMDYQILANQNGHIVCTHGGECLAGLIQALDHKIIDNSYHAVLDSTAHALKFTGFQDQYFQNNFAEEFGIVPKKELQNYPVLISSKNIPAPTPGKQLSPEKFQQFLEQTSAEIASCLQLKKRQL
ncbi:MAG: Threonine synthase [Candidatus Magnetoglobus multicellularis str. Araruama]|uniref:Threonine synthase n=1 Tax=Candidatus Magnetoglobus multicellularis str. Araruama TaxID=890399 RepID=A0A1V1PIJ1_9BACT|nr:MAG: Threonine synthase [Candidatus Magnetoglobus multicellularis str. Araruama]